MAIGVIVPSLGNTVENCIICSWKKKIGDQVRKGEVLFEIETDKTVFEIEAVGDGALLEIFFKEGELVPVLTTVAVIGTPGEETQSFRPVIKTETSVLKTSPAAKKFDQDGTIVPKLNLSEEQKKNLGTEREDREPYPLGTEPYPLGTELEQNIREKQGGISPRAKRFLKHHDLDSGWIASSDISGTGSHGRIIEEDVIQAFYSKPRFSHLARQLLKQGWMHKGTFSGINRLIVQQDLRKPGKKLSATRKIIAGRMHASLAATAQYTITISAQADTLLKLRKQLKEAAAKGEKLNITINDMVMFALVKTLIDFTAFNAELIDGALYQADEINLGFACDTPRGLLVPVVTNAHLLSLSALAAAVKTLSARAIDGSITPDDLSGGTFTVTNIGNLGVEYFTPILNTPQVAILGICAITMKPVSTGNNVHFVEHITLCLTADHQAIDGAPAARFLAALKGKIEHLDSLTGLDI